MIDAETVRAVRSGARLGQAWVKSHKLDLDKQDELGQTLLFHATSVSNLQAMRVLLKSGADPNVSTDQGTTPLMITVVKNHHEAFDLLMEYGIDLDASNVLGETALILAAKSGRIDMVRKLMDFGSNSEVMDNLGRTALDYAITKGYKGIVDLLDKVAAPKGPVGYRVEFQFGKQLRHVDVSPEVFEGVNIDDLGPVTIYVITRKPKHSKSKGK